MLVNAIKFTRTYPCLAEPGKIVVVCEPDATLDGVLRLLNALLPNVVSYNPPGSAMPLRRKPGLITLYSRKVTITQVAGVGEATCMAFAFGLLEARHRLEAGVWEWQQAGYEAVSHQFPQGAGRQ